MEQYLTSEQVAKILQVHPFTVLKYLKSGRIEGVKMGRVYRIKESDIEKFLKGISTTPTKQKQPEPELKPKQPKPEKNVHEIKFEDDEKENPKEYYKVI